MLVVTSRMLCFILYRSKGRGASVFYRFVFDLLH